MSTEVANAKIAQARVTRHPKNKMLQQIYDVLHEEQEDNFWCLCSIGEFLDQMCSYIVTPYRRFMQCSMQLNGVLRFSEKYLVHFTAWTHLRCQSVMILVRFLTDIMMKSETIQTVARTHMYTYTLVRTLFLFKCHHLTGFGTLVKIRNSARTS